MDIIIIINYHWKNGLLSAWKRQLYYSTKACADEKIIAIQKIRLCIS